MADALPQFCPHALQALAAAVRAAWPREAVLLLGGPLAEPPRVDCALPLPNDAEAIDRFAVPAAAFAAAEHQLRRTGRRWLGFAHSHPGGAAALSQRDRTTAWRCLQVVVGGKDPEALRAAAFVPAAEGFRPVPMPPLPAPATSLPPTWEASP